ncbi:hypothetical protein [Limosilactobacillus allomucosae]|uniref:hypothetical protein n=1 Tax=Limosilactobacillus allomucosae TaxID=3142938 RepID=UPI0032637CB4
MSSANVISIEKSAENEDQLRESAHSLIQTRLTNAAIKEKNKKPSKEKDPKPSTTDMINFVMLIFDSLIGMPSSVRRNKMIQKMRLKPLRGMIVNASISEEERLKQLDFLNENRSYVIKKLKQLLPPILDDYYERLRPLRIVKSNPELSGQPYISVVVKAHTKFRYIFENLSFDFNYAGGQMLQEHGGWKLQPKESRLIVQHLKDLHLPYISSYKINQDLISISRFQIIPIFESSSVHLSQRQQNAFTIDLKAQGLTPQNFSHDEMINELINAASRQGIGNLIASTLVFSVSSQSDKSELISRAAKQYIDRLQKKKHIGDKPSNAPVSPLMHTILDDSTIQIWQQMNELTADKLTSAFTERIQAEQKPLYDQNKNTYCLNIAVLGMKFNVVNDRFYMVSSVERKFSHAVKVFELLPVIDEFFDFAKQNAESRNLKFKAPQQQDFGINTFYVRCRNKKIRLHFQKDPESCLRTWKAEVLIFFDNCVHERQEAEIKRAQREQHYHDLVNGSGLVGSIIATAVAELAIKNEDVNGSYHLTAKNCVSILRNMSTIKNFYEELEHTEYDQQFRMISADDVDQIVNLVVDKELVDEKYHRMDTYNVTFYSLVPNKLTPLFVEESKKSTAIDTDFGLISRLERFVGDSDNDLSTFLQLLQALVKHPAVWCFKRSLCLQFLARNPETAEKFITTRYNLEDDRNTRKYLTSLKTARKSKAQAKL